ncbi:MAG: hypothetical protein PARBB_01883 [Parabacteroides distasonis]
MKTTLIIILTLVQFPFIVEGWISFLLNLLIKFLLQHDFLFFFNFLFLGGLISFVWWPLDMLSGACWALCECIKAKLVNVHLSFSEAMVAYVNQYPKI